SALRHHDLPCWWMRRPPSWPCGPALARSLRLACHGTRGAGYNRAADQLPRGCDSRRRPRTGRSGCGHRGLWRVPGPGSKGPRTGQGGVAVAGRPPKAAGEESQDGPLVSGDDGGGRPAQVAVGGATADPVKDYLKQIGKVPLLDAGQEVELAKRIEAGLFADEKLAEFGATMSDDDRFDFEWIAEDGRRAKNHLLEANLRLVVSLAKRYTGRGMLFLDLIQEGNLGLI